MDIDSRETTQWAIASVETKGAIGLTATVFDLVNRHTMRAHRLKLQSGGIDSGPIPITFSPSSSMSNYGYFSSTRPASFDDFDGVGGRLISASGLVWAWASLTLWDGSAYASKGLAWARMSGWGVSIPGAGLDHGWTTLVYGDGQPLGEVDAVPDLEMSMTELTSDKVQVTAQEERITFTFPGDVLFDFGKDLIKPEARKALQSAGALITSVPNRQRVYFNGYTDSIGDDAFNLDLSRRRATRVSEWFIGSYIPRHEAEPTGYGKANNVAPNTFPNGTDNPEGRAKNRRVEIVIIKRPS